MPSRGTSDPHFSRQLAAIRAHYGAAERWPDPAWQDALLRPMPWWRRAWDDGRLRAASLVLVAALSGATGWFAGRSGAQDDAVNPHLVAFREGQLLERGAFSRLEPVAVLRGTSGAMVAPLAGALLGHLRLPEPGMLPRGYHIVGAQPLAPAGDGPAGLRLVLASEEEGRAYLYVQGRWSGPQDGLTMVRRDGLKLVAWEEGPLAFALVAQADEDGVRALAAGIRRSLHGVSPAPGAPTTASVGAPGLAPITNTTAR